MRVAIAGKGGAGKTTVTATLARTAARAGRSVVCIDADSNPNLAIALGMPAAPPADTTLPPSLVSRRLDGPALSRPVDDVLAAHTATGPDGVLLTHLGMPGHAEEGCLCSAHAVVRAVLADLGDAETTTFLDLEASPEHFSRGTARHVDWFLFVAEPYFRSLETVRRMADLARELEIAHVGVVANKVRDDRDAEAITAFCERHGLDQVGCIPWDDAALDADRDRRPLVDARPSSPMVTALEDVLAILLAVDDKP